MSGMAESNNPRVRRAHAHAMLDRYSRGEVSREATKAIIGRAALTRKGAGSGFHNRLAVLTHRNASANLETIKLIVPEVRPGEQAPQVPVQIVRPEDPDLVARLEAKATEYETRMREQFDYVPPDNPDYFHEHSKLTVLRRVLDEGMVESGPMMEELYAHPGFDHFLAEEAIRIVSDYCTTGGQVNQGGTGLPELP